MNIFTYDYESNKVTHLELYGICNTFLELLVAFRYVTIR